MSCVKCIIPCNYYYRVTNIRHARHLVNNATPFSVFMDWREQCSPSCCDLLLLSTMHKYNTLYVHVYAIKGFIYRLSHDSHFDLDCAISTTYCRFSSGNIVDLLSRTVCTIVQCRRLLHKYLKLFFFKILLAVIR